ncbi:MAG: hypothetical protein M0031_06535, partial [Thermaerobacter sp.]|nr:hypothetical protein [Thermaerobacter sp.]
MTRGFLAVLLSLTLGQGGLAAVGSAAAGSPWPTVAVIFSPQAPYATAMDNVAPPGCMGPGEGRCAGNASVHLTKTVTAVYLTPRLDVSLGVYKSAAVPGDTLTYTATVTNVGS